MAFGISGFGAVQLRPLPQVFQALSLGKQPPVEPAPPFGFVNPTALVPVQRTGNPAVPANLTLAAHATFQAILKVNSAVLTTGQYPLQPKPFTTVALGATNPTLNAREVGPVPPSIPVTGNAPQGPISFSLFVPPANVGSPVTLVTTTAALLQEGSKPTNAGDPPPGTGGGPSDPPAANQPAAPIAKVPVATPTTPATAAPGAVAQIVATVKNLAIGAVYPSPVFSFTA